MDSRLVCLCAEGNARAERQSQRTPCCCWVRDCHVSDDMYCCIWTSPLFWTREVVGFSHSQPDSSALDCATLKNLRALMGQWFHRPLPFFCPRIRTSGTSAFSCAENLFPGRYNNFRRVASTPPAWHFFFIAIFQHPKFPPPTPTDFFHHLFSRQTTEVVIQVDLV